MAEHDAIPELDALIRSAQSSRAPDLDALHARRMVRRALLVGERARISSRRRLRYLGLCAAAALLLCIGTYALSLLDTATEVAVSAHGLPLRLSLKTGDTLVLAPLAKLAVLSEQPALRRVLLRQGSALFDVAKRKHGQRFEVETPHAIVRVRGTVFSVQVSSEQSLVRVHEGSVWIGERSLKAGEIWASPGRQTASAIVVERTLESDIRTALSARGLLSPKSAALDTPSASALIVAPPSATPISAAPASRKTAAAASEPAAQAEPPALSAALDEARGLLQRGQSEEAIALARVWADRDDAFYLVWADALRAQGRLDEACARYELLAERAATPLRAQAGFAAAQIALLSLHDAARALRDIERFRVDQDDSPLLERASALRAEALFGLGRADEARDVAERYLARQPDTQASQRMRAILEDAGVP